jgi:hypothetical protein
VLGRRDLGRSALLSPNRLVHPRDFRSEPHGFLSPTSVVASLHHNNTSKGHPPHASSARRSLPRSHHISRCGRLCNAAPPTGRGAVLLPLGRARSPPHFYLGLRDLHGLDSLSPHSPAQRLLHQHRNTANQESGLDVVASLNHEE